MADEFEEQGWVRIGVAASLAKEYAADQKRLLELVAGMLESALPAETEVERRGGLFSRKGVRRVRVRLGDTCYTLADPGRGPLSAARVRVVRGIALKTEEIPVEEWLEALGAALEERAGASESARQALSRFVG